MNSLTIAIVLFLCTAAAAGISKRAVDNYAVKRAQYEDMLVKTLDKIIKRGVCKTEFTNEDGETEIVPYNPCGTYEYCYSNDDDEAKYACTLTEDAPCEDPNACGEGETCEETTNGGVAGFTCIAAGTVCDLFADDNALFRDHIPRAVLSQSTVRGQDGCTKYRQHCTAGKRCEYTLTLPECQEDDCQETGDQDHDIILQSVRELSNQMQSLTTEMSLLSGKLDGMVQPKGTIRRFVFFESRR
ncbi:uncharacterized protein [Ptychodera flava]|uniref:uncharacterized protein n=1 Tax=Ptychodera flava TaxID=63121 RepID=UPI00396A4C75